MSKNYAVARVVQYTKAGVGKAERHIERKNQNYENMNVDLSQSPRNVHFKSCEDPTYSQHLDRLVEEGSVSLRGLKQDAKVFDEMPGTSMKRSSVSPKRSTARKTSSRR